MSLLLKKNGILEKTDWEWDSKTDKGEYKVKNIESYIDLLPLLHETCELGEDITLNDVLAFVAKHEDILSLIMPRFYIKQYLEAAKKEPTKETSIEYLELYTHLEFDNPDYDKAMPMFLHGLFLPQLHGLGYILENDDEESGYKKGERIPWGISFQETSNLLKLPIKICDVVVVSNGTDFNEPIHKIEATPHYTLFQIIYGILWELSWYGSPEETKSKGDSIFSVAAALKKEHLESK